MSGAFPALLAGDANAVLSLCLLPTLEGRPCWGIPWSDRGDPLQLKTTYLQIRGSREMKRSVWGRGKSRAAGARCFMPMSFSSFSLQTMKFLWTLTRLWSHMDLARRKPGWLLDQILVFLNKVIGKDDVDVSLLIRNKVEQSKWWCLLLDSIAQTEEGHLRMHINHTREKLWECNSFPSTFMLFGFKPQRHCLHWLNVVQFLWLLHKPSLAR